MSFLFWLEKNIVKGHFLDYWIFLWFSCVRASMTSYLVWNKIFGIFKILWSYDKMPIVWVWSGKWSALGHNAQRPVHSVRTSWPRTKYFSVRPSHSVNKYISSHQLEFKKIKKKIWVNCIFATKLIRKFFNNVLVHLRGLWRFRFIASSPLQPLQARPNLCLIAPKSSNSFPQGRTYSFSEAKSRVTKTHTLFWNARLNVARVQISN